MAAAAAITAIVAGAPQAHARCSVFDQNYELCDKLQNLEIAIGDLQNRVRDLEKASERHETELLEQLRKLWGRIADVQLEIVKRAKAPPSSD